MKTTLEIPDPIFRKAKARAAELGIPLRAYVSQAVEEKLTAPDKYVNKPWMKFAGALADLHEENVRIAKVIEDEFEQIEPQDRYRTAASQIPHRTVVLGISTPSRPTMSGLPR